ncbi:MAG: glycosyltransferase family 4 protein [Vicinamibacteria bacterium]|nr:glycosyltransferase family 4 protein [Vicinamibacteria bacterium]
MSRPLRLAFQLHPRLFGGQERFVLRLLRELRARGHVCLVASAPSGRVLREFTADGFEALALAGRDFGTDHARLAAWLVRHRVDVMQANLFSPLAGLAAGSVDVPHVWRVGGHPDVALAELKPARREGLLQLLASLSAAVVCNSRFVASRLRAAAVRRLRCIPNGVPAIDALPPAPSRGAADRARFSLAAHYYPVKRHADFLRAAARVARSAPGARFRVYGSSFGQAPLERQEQAVRALAARLGLAGRLDFGQAGAREVLAWSDVAVLPSLGESCSNAVLEAMAGGRPVIAARSGGNPELVVHGRSGRLFAAGDWRGLAREMLALMAAPERRERLGRAAALRARERFSMARCADAYEALYRALAV